MGDGRDVGAVAAEDVADGDAAARQVAVSGDVVEISGCPCAVVSPDHPEVICALATGLVEGILAASGSDRRVTEHDKHPERRRCTLRLTSVRGR